MVILLNQIDGFELLTPPANYTHTYTHLTHAQLTTHIYCVTLQKNQIDGFELLTPPANRRVMNS